jgi:hypothetical protein
MDNKKPLSCLKNQSKPSDKYSTNISLSLPSRFYKTFTVEYSTLK